MKGICAILSGVTLLNTVIGTCGVTAFADEQKKYDVTLNVVGVDNVLSSTFLKHRDELEETLELKLSFSSLAMNRHPIKLLLVWQQAEMILML